MSSQQTFQSILGKFSDGIVVLKAMTGYNPSKQELQIASLETMITTAEEKNAAALTAGTDLQNQRNSRRSISFRRKDSDTNCLENLFRNILSYIKAELGTKNSAHGKIDSIIKKISPPVEKKTPPVEGQEPQKSKSQSEKSYQSLVGFGNDIYTIISGLGTAYAPSNTNIIAANFKTKVDEFASLNAVIIKAEGVYSTAIQERNDIYYGEFGIVSTITSVKNYLASLEGGKSNASYLAFTSAVK